MFLDQEEKVLRNSKLAISWKIVFASQRSNDLGGLQKRSNFQRSFDQETKVWRNSKQAISCKFYLFLKDHTIQEAFRKGAIVKAFSTKKQSFRETLSKQFHRNFICSSKIIRFRMLFEKQQFSNVFGLGRKGIEKLKACYFMENCICFSKIE